MNLQEREKYTKDFVNRLRKENGLRALAKLKRGCPKHSGYCTIANSLPCREANYTFFGESIMLDGREFDEPEVAQFMCDYDDGNYPHLEIPMSAIKIKKPGDRKQTVLYPAHFKNGEPA